MSFRVGVTLGSHVTEVMRLEARTIKLKLSISRSNLHEFQTINLQQVLLFFVIKAPVWQRGKSLRGPPGGGPGWPSVTPGLLLILNKAVGFNVT